MTLVFGRFLVISLVSLVIRVVVLVGKFLNYDVSLPWSVEGVFNYGEIIDISISVSISVSVITIIFVLNIINVIKNLQMH